ncbi:GntR family transcriptional regulator/MocR family aminotransferase [Cupriavidus gilardii J11]|uniref:GntR family transcriptional regulator/MocR family aminotransferase n=1 Tax=Cupriavidus gilardii J11 TaxID=936133 RepID=A0A562BUF9_9BURK|nr:PLP-dependent aminotransferase family protein [Cupriavidus gilardii]TWG88343.1 GntR family transcriptional regulator/MocR family aminotransferase [Cupriavidus gilardii J11]
MRSSVVHQLMWHQLFPAPAREGPTLQSQLRTHLVNAVLDGRLSAGMRLPSSRELADMLGISRNTVVLAYERLAEDGYLENRPRSGYYVSPRYTGPAVEPLPPDGADVPASSSAGTSKVQWQARMHAVGDVARWLDKPRDWQRYRYPFLYGQFDPTLFPIADWRECSRHALDVGAIRGWAPDAIDHDDHSLVDQLIRRVLPRRGIAAKRDEILLTVGAQHGLYLLAELLIRPGTPVAVEDPGYMDARNILLRRGATLAGLPVDAQGVVPDEAVLRHCRYLYCTPSHQCPTGVTLTTERRLALLAWTRRHDGVLIEDDYDAETQYAGQPLPAIKAIDRDERVIYVGSLSKTLSPGLRIGYVVAPAPVIAQLRVLRRLMIRHPPANNQLAAALFIEHGHYDRLMHRMRDTLAQRATVLCDAVRRHLPQMAFAPPPGGSALWGALPDHVDTRQLRQAAMAHGILIESGEPFFLAAAPPHHHVRLGFSSIPIERIEPGIRELARLLPARQRPRIVHAA